MSSLGNNSDIHGRQAGKRCGLWEEDQAPHIQCETGQIINEAITEQLQMSSSGTAVMKGGGWKEGENFPPTTNIHLEKDEMKQGK